MSRILFLTAAVVTLLIFAATSVQPLVPAILPLRTQVQPEVTTFTGTILKDRDQFVLNDSASKTRYLLDNATKVAPFEGKLVKITGTLDVSKNLIHVDVIQEVVSMRQIALQRLNSKEHSYGQAT